jgi:hypothetical protein
MKSRRLMGAPSSGLGPHITTPMRKNAAVHHSKNCALMSHMGRLGHSAMSGSMSGLPPKADLNASSRHDVQVPLTDMNDVGHSLESISEEAVDRAWNGWQLPAHASSPSSASASFFSRSATGSRMRLTRFLTFVPVERSRVGLFARLRDKVTPSAQPLGRRRPRQGSSLSILTEPPDERAAFHPVSSSAAIRRTGVTEYLAEVAPITPP